MRSGMEQQHLRAMAIRHLDSRQSALRRQRSLLSAAAQQCQEAICARVPHAEQLQGRLSPEAPVGAAKRGDRPPLHLQEH